MTAARTSAAVPFEAMAAPMVFAAALTEALSEATRASFSLWSAAAETWLGFSRDWTALARQALTVERAGAQALVAEEALILEDAAGRLAEAGEQAFEDLAGARLVPFPE
jgi:hypothetical protein